jgi:glycosyltransferase involved in cell wall biosynthesis
VKIAFVSDGIYPYFMGGKEKRLHELSMRLARRGHDVHIYTMHWWDSPRRMVREHGVTLHAIAKKRPLYKGDKRSIMQGIMFGLACLKLGRVRADVIDVDHMPFFPIFGAWVAHFFYRRPLIGTWHEALSRQDWRDYMGAASALSSAIERISTRLPRYIVAASEHTRQNLAQFHSRERGVSVVASGIDTKMLESVEPIDAPCDILYVGRLVKDKKVDVLLDAFKIVLVQKPDARLVIIGDGIERQNLESQAQNLDIASNVTFAGRVARDEDIYGYMKRARVFTSASVREGFGIVTIEAIACGTAVVVSDSEANAAKDLVDDGVTGSVVATKPEAFARACLHWLGTSPDTGRLSETAMQFDWDTLTTNLENRYTEWGARTS